MTHPVDSGRAGDGDGDGDGDIDAGGNGDGDGGVDDSLYPGVPDLRGGCPGLNSGFPGDEMCLAPPDPSEGIQIHLGPASYANPGNFVIQPDQENSWCINFHLPELEDAYFGR